MNHIDRSLVKSQAKQIIKNKVFMLFLVSAIVLILTNGLSIGINTYYESDNLGNLFGPNNNNSYSDNNSGQNTPEDFFKYFGDSDGSGNDYSDGNNYSSDNPIESFGQRYNTPSSKIIGGSNSATIIPVTSYLGLNNIGIRGLTIISIILSPLLVSLCGLYITLIKRNHDEQFELGKEIKNIFKVSFDATYGKKLCTYILRNLFTTLWAILLIFPGIFYHYSTYFAYQIMCEYPNIKPTDALKLSKKMVWGNRGELFVLDLSFIGWWFICGITFGIASIYVIPYYMTTQALFYENFKIRALQEGRIMQDDFLTQEERASKYNNGGYGNAQSNAEYYNQNCEQDASSYYYNPNNSSSNAQGQSGEQNENQSASAFYTPGNSQQSVPTEQEPVQSGSYPSYAPNADNAESETASDNAGNTQTGEPVYYQLTPPNDVDEPNEAQPENQNPDINDSNINE